jgi:hypothetical protein
MKKMAAFVGAFALTSATLTANAGFFRWTSYSVANCFGVNKTVAWWNEHPQQRLTESIHFDNHGNGNHKLSTGWIVADNCSVGHTKEWEGPRADKWHVQGYNYYWDYRLGSVYDWYSDAFDCNVSADSKQDYPEY